MGDKTRARARAREGDSPVMIAAAMQAAALAARVGPPGPAVAYDLVVQLRGGGRRLLTRVGPERVAIQSALMVDGVACVVSTAPISVVEFRRRFLSPGPGPGPGAAGEGGGS